MEAHTETSTEPTESPKRRRFVRLWLLAGAMATAAVVIARAARLTSAHAFLSGVHVPWIALVAGFLLAAVYAVHLHFRAETHTMTLDEILLVVGFFVAAPLHLLAAQLLGSLLVLAVYRRLPALKVAFNLAQLALGTAAGLAVFRALADPVHPLSVRSWIAALLASLVASTIALAAIAIAIIVTEGRTELRTFAASFGLGLAGTLVNTMLGLVAIVVLSESAFGWVLLAGPIVVVFLAYRAYLSERSKSSGLEFLYAASEVLNSAIDLEDGLIGLLDFARDTFHAELAEIVVQTEAPTGAVYRTAAGPGTATERLAAVDLATAAPLLDAAAQAGTAIAQGATMLAPLGDGSGSRGAVLVDRGRALLDAFTKDELRLFETFANHLGTTFEKMRLNTSLAQLREAKQELAYQAYHDSMTGLANRALFHDRVRDAIDEARDYGRRVAVLFIDLDDFKTVNDTMGHAAGDALLTEIASRIDSCMGPDDTAARLGGDEFAVLLPHPAHELEVRNVADRILVALGDPIMLDGAPVVMHASIGIAWHDGAVDAAELMQHADVAMYTAKRNGKGRFDEFEPTMSLSVAHRHQLKVGLERAIANNELVVHYQPVIDVATGELSAFEALLRWQDPTRGLIPPTEFVGVAEETGLIVPIGRFVIQEACRQAARWSSFKPDLRMYVNLSTRQLADEDIIGVVASALAEAHLRPNQLQLEVTETAMMHDIDQAAAVLEALKAIGGGVANDDFGTGFSSLSYLRQLPIDVVKIAKPIIDAICVSDADAAFVRGIVELGHVVGMKVVAEGVEHVEQYAQLVDMGCDFVQGFYYSSSLEPRSVETLLRTATNVPRELLFAR